MHTLPISFSTQHEPVNVWLFDPDRDFAEDVRAALSTLCPDWHVEIQDTFDDAHRPGCAALSMAVVDVTLAEPRTGLQLCSGLRGAHPAAAILALSGEDSEAVRLAALRAGASDHLGKLELSLKELAVRLRVLLAAWTVPAAALEPPPGLTTAEQRLLQLLYTHPTVTFQQIVELCLERGAAGAVRAAHRLVYRLRSKLPDVAASIDTVRGTGYALRQARRAPLRAERLAVGASGENWRHESRFDDV
jgi:DNA-binding response OmpR family regulator